MPNSFDSMSAQARELTPKTGYNLVGLDDYEDPGEQLFLIGRYRTAKEALEAQKDHKQRNKDIRTFIYHGPDEPPLEKEET